MEKHTHWHLLIDPRDHEQRSAVPDGWRGDGIIARISSRTQLDQICEKRLPIVNVDDMYQDLDGVGAVITDEAERARLAADHLIARRFRKFAYFAPPQQSILEEPRSGVCKVDRPAWIASITEDSDCGLTLPEGQGECRSRSKPKLSAGPPIAASSASLTAYGRRSSEVGSLLAFAPKSRSSFLQLFWSFDDHYDLVATILSRYLVRVAARFKTHLSCG